MRRNTLYQASLKYGRNIPLHKTFMIKDGVYLMDTLMTEISLVWQGLAALQTTQHIQWIKYIKVHTLRLLVLLRLLCRPDPFLGLSMLVELECVEPMLDGVCVRDSSSDCHCPLPDCWALGYWEIKIHACCIIVYCIITSATTNQINKWLLVYKSIESCPLAGVIGQWADDFQLHTRKQWCIIRVCAWVFFEVRYCSVDQSSKFTRFGLTLL